jgi:HSP20 family protein
MAQKAENVPSKAKGESAPTKRAGWDRFLDLREEIDHLFDEFHDNWPFGRVSSRVKPRLMDSPFAWGEQMPAIDVIEKGDSIVVKAELPGMEEKDIDVELSDHMLTISGEKKEEREEGKKEGNYYLSERRYGTFRRSVAVPEGIDKNKVDAAFSKGVLTVTLQKTPDAREKVKKIKVKATA